MLDMTTYPETCPLCGEPLEDWDEPGEDATTECPRCKAVVDVSGYAYKPDGACDD